MELSLEYTTKYYHCTVEDLPASDVSVVEGLRSKWYRVAKDALQLMHAILEYDRLGGLGMKLDRNDDDNVNAGRRCHCNSRLGIVIGATLLERAISMYCVGSAVSV